MGLPSYAGPAAFGGRRMASGCLVSPWAAGPAQKERPPPSRGGGRSGSGQEATGSCSRSLSLLAGSEVTERRLETMMAATTTPTATTVIPMRSGALSA